MDSSGLKVPLDARIGDLSVGERQRVEILKALYRDVRILVLDEPTAVLTPQEADTLFAAVRGMVDNGLSVIFISHKLREVLAFSDRIAVLRHGKKTGEMVTAEADAAKIIRMMVGEDHASPTREAGSPRRCGADHEERERGTGQGDACASRCVAGASWWRDYRDCGRVG